MATIKDIAKASRVCPATVSNVLNNTRAVHPQTRERVLEAARLANYRPNALARGLVGKRMNTIGVVFLHREADASLDLYFVAILDGVLAQARRQRQNVTLVTSGSWDDDAGLLPTLCDGRCDGVLLIVPPVDDSIAPGLKAAGIPCVITGSRSSDAATASVDVDNVDGACRIVEYLIAQGHRRIAYVSPGLQFTYLQERREGYLRALERHGLPTDPQLIRHHPFGPFAMRPQIQALLALPQAQRPTAIFCAFDLIALEVVALLQEQGLQIPNDISVVGFDDVPNTATSIPALTTVRQPFREIGDRAAERLLAEISKRGDDGGRELLPTALVIRASVAPPRQN
jgi:LacI family transcriptional regulator